MSNFDFPSLPSRQALKEEKIYFFLRLTEVDKSKVELKNLQSLDPNYAEVVWSNSGGY